MKIFVLRPIATLSQKYSEFLHKNPEPGTWLKQYNSIGVCLALFFISSMYIWHRNQTYTVAAVPTVTVQRFRLLFGTVCRVFKVIVDY